MPKIFISYRRDDSQYVTDSIHDYLIAHFGNENVFLDVESIPFGVNFRDYIAEQIAAHDVVLVIIGPDWARIMQERADQPNDFVRIEIESALKQKKLVVPVLVKEAKMPNFADLPASISELQWLNSAEIRRKPRFEDDCRYLIEGIAQLSGMDSHSQTSSIQSQFILPKLFEWIPIPAGQVTLVTEEGWGRNYIPEGQTRIFEVETFSIAKYPITVAQYNLFIDDDGYQNSEYWTPTGWFWREKENIIQPRYWNNPKWHSSDHPVVGISWYEAYASTKWISLQAKAQIDLATEQQWQRAAQGNDGRMYPWGNGFDIERCNNAESGFGTTTPVIKYPNGRSPYGVIDMSGNVWEWCLSQYKTGSVEVDNSNIRVVRGGSWGNYHDLTRVVVRNWFDPDVRLFNLGFRCVLIQ